MKRHPNSAARLCLDHCKPKEVMLRGLLKVRNLAGPYFTSRFSTFIGHCRAASMSLLPHDERQRRFLVRDKQPFLCLASSNGSGLLGGNPKSTLSRMLLAFPIAFSPA